MEEVESGSLKLREIQFALFGAVLLLLIKLPQLFLVVHFEELRDLEAFTWAAQGKIPYRDFYWHYGPLGPYFFGQVFRFLPPTLGVLRALSLSLWALGAFYVVRLLYRATSSGKGSLLGLVLVGALFALPNYSHNHVLATVFSLIMLFYLEHFLGTGKSGAASLGCLWVVLSTRPVLIGYGAVLFYIAAILLFRPDQGRWLKKSLVVFLASLLLWPLIWGSEVIHALYPRAIAVGMQRPMPDLWEIGWGWAHGTGAKSFLYHLWGLVDGSLYYGHFFLWPAAIFLLGWPRVTQWRLAGLAALLGLSASLDTFYYGSGDARKYAVMMSRGQYFLCFTFLSFFLIAWSLGKKRALAWAGVGIGVVLTWWSNHRLIENWSGVHRNPYPLLGFTAWPENYAGAKGFLDHLSRKCLENGGPVFAGFYAPGVGLISRCSMVLERDVHLLDGGWESRLREGESPYRTETNQTVGQIVVHELNRRQPRTIAMNRRMRPFWQECESIGEGWRQSDFTSPFYSLRICDYEGNDKFLTFAVVGSPLTPQIKTVSAPAPRH